MEEITIKLPVNAWQVVMNALGHRPYMEVVDLVAEIKKQGDAAIAAPKSTDADNVESQDN